MKSSSDSQKQSQKLKQSDKNESQINSDGEQEDQNSKKKQSSVQMRKNKQSNNQRNNNNKSISQKESVNVLENQQINLKKFRVFYGLIATFEDTKSPVHFNKIKCNQESDKTAALSNKLAKSSDIKQKQHEEIDTLNFEIEIRSTAIENFQNQDNQLTDTEKEIEFKTESESTNLLQDNKDNKLTKSQNQLLKESQEQKPNEQKKKKKNKNQLQKQESSQEKVSDQQSSQELANELKEWFNNLTVDQRMNTLTTTSPYLADVLINMQVATNKNGPTLFAKHLLASQQSNLFQKEMYQQNLLHKQYPYQSANGYLGPNMSNYRQQYLSQYQSQQQISALQQHYSQSYGQQYFINGNFMYPQTQQKQLSKYQTYGSEIYSQFGLSYPYEYQMQREYDFYEYENQIQSDSPAGLSLNQSSQNFLNSCNYQSKFEENFYQRVQCKNEIDRSIQENQERHNAKENICKSLKFCDLFMYMDTISVSQNLVEDPEQFFEMLSQITQGNSFKQSCKFLAEQENQKLQNIQIETPQWFKPQKFHSFAEWIAVIYEENLWANFNYYKAKQKKSPHSFITIQTSQEQTKNQSSQNQTQKQNPTSQKQNSHNILQSIQNLFEQKEINEYVGLNLHSCKVHTLASCWIESNIAQRNQIFDSLNSFLSEKPAQTDDDKIQIQQNYDEFLQSGSFYYIAVNDSKSGSNKSLDLHLYNKRFDSEKLQLIIKKEEFQDIQNMALQSIQKLEQIELFENNQKSNDKQKNKKQQLIQIGQISENKSKIDQNSNKTQNIKSNIQSKQMNQQNSTMLSIASLDTTFHSDLKYKQALSFIFSLFQTSIDRIENGKDYICRYFLKLIEQMHQEQLIQELLGGITSAPSKISQSLNDSKSFILQDQSKINGESNKNQNFDAKNQKKKQKQLTQPQLKEQKPENELITQKKNKKKKKKKAQVKIEDNSNIISAKQIDNSIQQNIKQKMADTNDVIINIKVSETNEEGLESSHIEMSDTISNNSALLNENKKLEIFKDDTSLKSIVLIQSPLIQKEVKQINKNKDDEDEWTYVERKQTKNENQQIINEYVQIMLDRVLLITSAQQNNKMQENEPQGTELLVNSQEISDNGINIELKSQISTGFCEPLNEQQLDANAQKQDYTMTLTDQRNNESENTLNVQDATIQDQNSDHNDAHPTQSQNSLNIEVNANNSFSEEHQTSNTIEIDEKVEQQKTKISKFKSQVVSESKNTNDESFLTNSTQKKKRKKKGAKMSQQDAMNLFIIKQQSQNSEHLQSSLLNKKQTLKKESNPNAQLKLSTGFVISEQISPVQPQKFNESENNINKKFKKFDEKTNNSDANQSFQKSQENQFLTYQQIDKTKVADKVYKEQKQIVHQKESQIESKDYKNNKYQKIEQKMMKEQIIDQNQTQTKEQIARQEQNKSVQSNKQDKINHNQQKKSPQKISPRSYQDEYQQVKPKSNKYSQQKKYSSKQKLLNPETDNNQEIKQSLDIKPTNETIPSNSYQQKRITHSSKQHSQIYNQTSFNEFQNVSSWNNQNTKSSLNLESKEFKVSNQKQSQFYKKEEKTEYDNQQKQTQPQHINQSSSTKDQAKKQNSYTHQQSSTIQNPKQIQASTYNESNQISQANQINSAQKIRNVNLNSSNIQQQENNQFHKNTNQESENKERYQTIETLRNNGQINRKLDFHSQNNVQACSDNSFQVDNSFIESSDRSVSSYSHFKNDHPSYQQNYQNIYQAMSPQDQKQNLLNQGQQLENIYANKIIYKNDQGQQSFPVSQQTNIQYYNQDDIDHVQNQSSYPQPQANYYPQFSGPVNTTQIAHINQMNQYNINSYPNMGISQIQTSNPNQGLSFSQPSNQFYFQIQGIQNQLSFVNNNYVPNYDQQNMMQFGRSMDANQFQNCQMGMKYPHQLYDQNLPQNIECKFYEKFDNDIYDEVNNIQRHLNITKEERNFVLQKLQNLCEKVFKEKDQKEVLKQNKIEKLQISNKSFSHHLPNKNYAGNKNQIPKIKQFGSLVTGLALESSDMDMAVTNLYLPDREKMIESLDLFAEEIKRWEMIQDLNAISTASIPVIKAVVDLKQLREKEMISLSDSQKDQDQFSQDFWQAQASISSTAERNYFNQILQRPQIPNSLQKLKIDITFDDNITQDEDEDNKYELEMNMGFTPPHYFLTKQSFINIGLMENKTHLGISSCKLIKHYVESYKCLKEVSIVLKLYLSALQLNSPYHGGLSSYSTVLLLVAYMNKWNLRMSPTLTPSRLLMGFLDYYSYYFNVSLFGIDVSNNGSFFEHGSPESYFVILDPLNENNNTTKNSFLTHEIIKSFRKAFNSLKSKLMQYQQQQQTNINDNLLDIILERNLQKEIELDQKCNQQAQNNKEESFQNQQTQQTQTEELMVEHCKQITQQQTQDI